MIKTQQIKHGGVQIADLDRILGDLVADLIRLAVANPGLDAAARHPHW